MKYYFLRMRSKEQSPPAKPIEKIIWSGNDRPSRYRAYFTMIATPFNFLHMKIYCVCLLLLFCSCSGGEVGVNPDSVPVTRDLLVFADEFDSLSRGELRQNFISEPSPLGLGYSTDTPHGYELKKWIISDEWSHENRRSFWCIPQRRDGSIMSYAQQSGRSKNSVAYAETPLPDDSSHYTIEFRQWCNDNDYIGYIIGASEAHFSHDGAEFGYQRQLPGTDDTVDDAYLSGDLGEMKVDGQALMRQWVQHRIEVKGKSISWYQNDVLIAINEVSDFTPAGYFGIRQSFERGTRYDDVRITIVE